MVLTDTHTHLYYETDPEKQRLLIERCEANHIERLFLPNVNVASIEMINRLVNAYPDKCFAMAGLHPCDVKDGFESELGVIYESIADRKIYAIGEIGIDLYWDKTTLSIQQDAFKQQINWAKELNLPIVIHCREAFDEVFEILEELNDDKLRGIFHCFTGNLEQGLKAIELGFYLGIGGVVTYKKAGLDLVLANIPLADLVLETDSPYLAPVPYRGKPNESSYLIHIAQKIADIYGVSLDEVAEITTENAKKVFGI